MTLLVTDEDDVALLGRIALEAYADNGIPNEALAADRVRGAAIAADVLAGVLLPRGLRTSPLGPAWSGDLDCHLRSLPAHSALLDTGWVPLDHVLRRLQRPGEDRWAVTRHGKVLTSADLHLHPPPSPLEAVLDRCRRQGEVRLREVLELRQLHRSGTSLPSDPVIALAADIEHGLGHSLLDPWRTGRAQPCPAKLLAESSRLWLEIRKRLVAIRDATRPRLVVTLSGVDGAGKSSVARELVDALDRCGIPSGHVWTRPGMSVPILSGLRRNLKRRLHEEGSSGMQRRAEDPEAELMTRTGVLGFVWSLVVTVTFLCDAWQQHLRASGVVIYDRHVVDGLVTLDLVYGGSDLRLHRFLIRWLLPPAHFSLYLEVAPEVAAQRKPDDFFTVESLRRQVDEYERHLASMTDVHRLASEQSPEGLARQVLSHILSTRRRPPGGGRDRMSAASQHLPGGSPTAQASPAPARRADTR